MWTVRGTETDHAFGKIAPKDDIDFTAYVEFKEEFGEDGNVVAIGVEGPIFELDFFNGIYDLSEGLANIRGAEGVMSISRLASIVRDDSLERFGLEKICTQRASTQAEVDSIKKKIENLPFYHDLIIDQAGTSTLLAVTLNRELLDSKEKLRLYDEIMEQVELFEKKFNVDVKAAGLPLLRANVHKTIVGELILFLILAIVVMALTLAFFFRAYSTVFLPLIVVGIVIVWSLGIVGLLGYKITLLISLVPALITVIGIPNTIYLITKYHIEFRRTHNKVRALIRVVERIGVVTIMTNATTAVGFGVLVFTDIRMLREFGLVASLSVVTAFFISLLLMPIFFSFMKPPQKRHTRHLDRKALHGFIKMIDYWVHNKRWAIYIVSICFTALAFWGIYKIEAISFMADDLPSDNQLVEDIRYLEQQYGGVMPLEIVIDGKKKRSMAKLSNLKKIKKLQVKLSQYEELSRSVSLADVAAFTRQALWSEGSAGYKLPNRDEYNAIKSFLRNSDLGGKGFSKSVTDSLQQKARISMSMKDIGSQEMTILLDSIQADLDGIFDPEKYDAVITGTTKIFIKSNSYLIDNLLQSLAIAFCVIALLMGLLFRSVRMVVISLVPNFLPLLMVAGMMGFTGIALKPSTALVFSLAFGIAVDDSIHFLARYRLARRMGDTVSSAISNSFKDTGVSMIYTSIILFFGFVIFTASSFGGTQALGLLASLTLFIAMFGNLVLLPALLLDFDKSGDLALSNPLPTDDETSPLNPRQLVEDIEGIE